MMKHPDYNSPTELKNFLESRNMAMQKKFGQNFLVNGDARKLIIDTLQIKPGTKIWEIGPGLGAMTYEILQTGAELTVFEIDHGFAAAITEFFADYKEQGKFKWRSNWLKAMSSKLGKKNFRKTVNQIIFLETFRIILQPPLSETQSNMASGLTKC